MHLPHHLFDPLGRLVAIFAYPAKFLQIWLDNSVLFSTSLPRLSFHGLWCYKLLSPHGPISQTCSCPHCLEVCPDKNWCHKPLVTQQRSEEGPRCFISSAAGLHLLVPKRTGTGQSEIYAWFHSRCVTQSGGCEVSKYHHRLQIAPKKQNVGLGRWMQGSERVWGRWSTAAHSSRRKIHQEDGRTEKDQKCCIITENGNTKKTLLLLVWCLVEKKKNLFKVKLCLLYR